MKCEGLPALLAGWLPEGSAAGAWSNVFPALQQQMRGGWRKQMWKIHLPPAACLSEAAKSRFGLFFSCGGNDCLVLLMEKGCWFWQWGYHVAMQTCKAGWKQILFLSLAIFLTISQVKTSQGTLVGFLDAANNNTLEPLTVGCVTTLVISQLLAMTAERLQVRFSHPKWAQASFNSSRGEHSLEFALSTAQLPERE